jgi:hypothetical protein
MTRMSKKGERRAVSFRKRRKAAPKTGPKKDHLQFGYRTHKNAIEGESITNRFIPEVK